MYQTLGIQEKWLFVTYSTFCHFSKGFSGTENCGIFTQQRWKSRAWMKINVLFMSCLPLCVKTQNIVWKCTYWPATYLGDCGCIIITMAEFQMRSPTVSWHYNQLCFLEWQRFCSFKEFQKLLNPRPAPKNVDYH